MTRLHDQTKFRVWLNGRNHIIEKEDGAEYCGELCSSCKQSEMRVYKYEDWVGKPVWSLKCPSCFYRSVQNDY